MLNGDEFSNIAERERLLAQVVYSERSTHRQKITFIRLFGVLCARLAVLATCVTKVPSLVCFCKTSGNTRHVCPWHEF